MDDAREDRDGPDGAGAQLLRCHACRAPVPAPDPGPGKPRRRSSERWRRLRDGLIERRERALDDRVWRLTADPARARRRLRRHRTRHPALRADDLAAVCCLFNPKASRLRLDSHRAFAERVRCAGVPLLTVELMFGDRPHELEDGADVLRLRSSSVMWQKERLLNLGIRELLRRGYGKIAWLDADIRFLDEGWPRYVAEALERARLVQVFERVLVQQGPGRPPARGVSSIKHYVERDRADDQRARSPRLFRRGYPAGYSGYGWAARAEVLQQAPLYDAAVVGGGDKLIHLASLPRSDRREEATGRWFRSRVPPCPSCGHESEAPRWRSHYREWAHRWSKAVEGRIGYAETTIVDSFHAPRAGRRYRARREILLRNDFDPASDLATNADGCLEWTPGKPELHAAVREYLEQREAQ